MLRMKRGHHITSICKSHTPAPWVQVRRELYGRTRTARVRGVRAWGCRWRVVAHLVRLCQAQLSLARRVRYEDDAQQPEEP
jgi:hypothetical protein